MTKLKTDWRTIMKSLDGQSHGHRQGTTVAFNSEADAEEFCRRLAEAGYSNPLDTQVVWPMNGKHTVQI